MSSWRSGVLGLGLIVLLGGATGEAGKRGPKRAGWFSDYGAARAAARQSGKPLFLVFRCQP